MLQVVALGEVRDSHNLSHTGTVSGPVGHCTHVMYTHTHTVGLEAGGQ